MPKSDLTKPAEYLRSSTAKGITATESPIDPKGGKFGAGLIRGASAIAAGEALGHGFWLDSELLDQVHAALNSADGLKSRFTHPDLSADGMGKQLGRVYAGERAGDRVTVDLHLLESAHDAPDGDLAGYVLSLATEAPQDFGMSIVFSRDRAAEQAFEALHTVDQVFTDPDSGEQLTRKVFRSPDPANTKHLRHARLQALHAVDVVDDPAANPDGLFHRGPAILKDAEALLSFGLGLTTEPPELVSLDVHPERAAAFLTRFLTSHGLELHKPTPPETPPPADPAAIRAELQETLAAYVQEFGATNGAAWAAENKPLIECLRLARQADADAHLAELAQAADQIKTLRAEVAETKDRLASVKFGEPAAVSGTPAAAETVPEVPGLTPGLARFVGAMRARKTSRN
jgi:hypothetical protein